MTSVTLIQQLLRFRATPPDLLNHLLRQPAVRQNAALKHRVVSHPRFQLERGNKK
ncbi:MAG: hypothetical protein IPK82_31795 [Polyangiaceae bacterium]|nr:hypothetical protein [Polyangiaceae bacterium]